MKNKALVLLDILKLTSLWGMSLACLMLVALFGPGSF